MPLALPFGLLEVRVDRYLSFTTAAYTQEIESWIHPMLCAFTRANVDDNQYSQQKIKESEIVPVLQSKLCLLLRLLGHLSTFGRSFVEQQQVQQTSLSRNL